MLLLIPLSYNLRNLIVRKGTTIAAALGIGLVVFVFAAVQMMLAGLDKMLNSTGRHDTAIVMSKGADVELSSTIEVEKVGLILDKPEVARAGDGKPLGIGELVVVLTMDKTDGTGIANVTVRGVDAGAMAFRPEIKLIAGRAPTPGTDEVMIGKQVNGRFKGLKLGGTFELRKNRPVSVVGIFETGGSVFESEAWGDIDTFRAAFGRQGVASSVRVRLAATSKYEAFEASIEQDKALQLEVMRETDYYEKQSEGMAMFLGFMGYFIAISFAIGAVIGAMITMYSSIANRRREIGTLRALGFGRLGILFSFTLEAVMLTVLGGAIGVVGAMLLQGRGFEVANGFSIAVLKFSISGGGIVSSLIFAMFMGLFGGVLPAWRAAFTPPIEAMRNG